LIPRLPPQTPNLAVAASSRTFVAYIVGICFTSVGKSGLDLLSDIIVGDLTLLEWRGFFGAGLSIPLDIARMMSKMMPFAIRRAIVRPGVMAQRRMGYATNPKCEHTKQASGWERYDASTVARRVKTVRRGAILSSV
jgi:hypothetical protein